MKLGFTPEEERFRGEAAEWLTYSTEAATEVAGLNRRVGLDIVEFPEWSAEGYVHLLNRTEWNTVPTVVQLHGPLAMFGNTVGWPDREGLFYRIGTHMEATAVQLADAVYSSNACSARWCAEYYGRTEEEIPVIHAGVDTELFRPATAEQRARLRREHRLEESDILIGYCGRLVEEKGLIELMRAVASLPGHDACARPVVGVLGEGPLREELARLARERNIRLIQLAKVPHSSVAEFMRALEIGRAHV